MKNREIQCASSFPFAIWQFPNLRIVDTYPGKDYLYHFEESSPYPGPIFEILYPGQCAVYLFNNEREVISEGGRGVGKEMVRTWTGLTYGKEPWEAFQNGKKFLRFGPGGKFGMKDLDDDDMRDY